MTAFADDALSHMQEHGLDTVFYVKGADSHGEGAEDLFTYHSKYTKASVNVHLEDCESKGVFDSYAKTALTESAQWLVNSLDETLKSSLRARLAARPTGPQAWMLIAKEVQADSIRRCTALRKEFEALTLAQFKGENVIEFAEKVEELLVPLEKDKQLPTNHLVDLIDKLTACSVMDFKIYFMNKRAAVEDFTVETSGMDAKTIEKLPNKITYLSLLEDAKTRFNNLKSQWGTASKEQAHISQVKALQAKLDRMEQELKAAKDNGGGKTIICYKCNKPVTRSPSVLN